MKRVSNWLTTWSIWVWVWSGPLTGQAGTLPVWAGCPGAIAKGTLDRVADVEGRVVGTVAGTGVKAGMGSITSGLGMVYVPVGV